MTEPVGTTESELLTEPSRVAGESAALAKVAAAMKEESSVAMETAASTYQPVHETIDGE